jgi:hypothetical protein
MAHVIIRFEIETEPLSTEQMQYFQKAIRFGIEHMPACEEYPKGPIAVEVYNSVENGRLKGSTKMDL